MEKAEDENDVEKILRDIAQHYYDKEAEIIQEAAKLNSENKVLQKELEKLREEYNELKYGNDKIAVGDEMRMLVNMYEKHQSDRNNPGNNNRLLKYLL